MTINPRPTQKKVLPEVPVHSGMIHRTNGEKVTHATSRTKSERLSADDVMKPTVAKRGLAPVAIHDHHANTTGTERGHASAITRETLESEGVGTGSKHPLK